MTVDDLLKVLSNPDMIRIINDDSDVYVGYLGTMQYHKGDLSKIMKQEVHSLQCIPEIRHRNWREKGLDAPLLPDAIPTYAYADLQSTLYYTIYI